MDMNDAEFQSWVAQVPTLSQNQLRALEKHVHGFKASVGSKPLLEEDWFLRGFYEALRKHGLLTNLNFKSVANSKEAKTYKTLKDDLFVELEKLLPPKNKYQSRNSLALLTGDCLVKWCKKKYGWTNEELSAKVVFRHVKDSLEALDNEFPGYRESNLFQMVLGDYGNANACEVKDAASGSAPGRSSDFE